MTPPEIQGSDFPDPVAEAHKVLALHYGDEVRPVHEVCKGIFAWLDALGDEHSGDKCEEGQRDEVLHRIAEAYGSVGFSLSLASTKSNLLYRLLYLRQPIRTKKCPEHDGHWSGYTQSGESCECAVGLDITGWLP